jgi:spore germination cell wall hydrolase CwlJ-like protein
MMTEAAILCLAMNVYWEARDQDLTGQIAVAQVTVNRAESRRYPDHVCDVVYDKHQFSWYWDGKSDTPRNAAAWALAQNVARAVANGYRLPELVEATHYHAVYVQPYWRTHFKVAAVIGDHIFYRET